MKSGSLPQISRSSSTVTPQISAMALMASIAISCETLILGKDGRDSSVLYGLGCVARFAKTPSLVIRTVRTLSGLAIFANCPNSSALRGRVGSSLGKSRTFLNHFLSARICLNMSSVAGSRKGRGSLVLEISNQTLHVALSRSVLVLNNQNRGMVPSSASGSKGTELSCLTPRPRTLFHWLLLVQSDYEGHGDAHARNEHS